MPCTHHGDGPCARAVTGRVCAVPLYRRYEAAYREVVALLPRLGRVLKIEACMDLPIPPTNK